MKKIFCAAFLLASFSSVAQDSTLIRLRIHAMTLRGVHFNNFNLFTFGGQKNNLQLGLYNAITLDKTVLTGLYHQRPEQLSFQLPYNNSVLKLQFTKAHILDNTKFIIADVAGEHEVPDYEKGVFYHGIIEGINENSFATLAVFSNSIKIFISYRGKNIQAGSIDDKQLESSDYGVFGELPGNNDAMPVMCGTAAPADAARVSVSQQYTLSPASINTYSGRVIRAFFDCSYDFYLHYSSSTAQCYNRISAMFNQAALCYANETINTSIAEIRVWTVTDPYTHNTRDNGLATFKDYVRDNYTGDLAMLCDWQPTNNSGLADGIAVLCQAWSNVTNGPYIYNDMNYNNYFINFPVAADAPDVYLMIHEMGHVLGSAHTQWCGWPGGAIDNCFTTEGGCPGGPTPVRGTLMSYCCLSSIIGIDFNYGFGPLPGNAIRTHINSVACLTNISTVCDSSLYLQGNISNTDYTVFEAHNSIIAQTNLSASANVIFDAGKIIDLKPPFLAPAGSKFRALNEGCGGIYRQSFIPKKL
ncbi:MAG: M12 family metallo-peptidase [Ferruginibacter sp.]